MQLKGKSSFVTGGGSGIGKAICLELGGQGCSVTVADWNIESARAVAEELVSRGGEAQAVQVDVTDNAAQQRAFDQHLELFSSLDVVCLNAGILENGNILSEEGGGRWEQTLDIDLRAQMMGTRLAALAMQKYGSKGVILFTASAGGIFPMPQAPAYAAAKAGLINFARSVAPRLAKRGIRVCAICPQTVDTPMVAAAGDAVLAGNKGMMPDKYAGKHLSTSQVVKGVMYLLEDDSQVGTMLFIHVTGRAYEFTHSKASMRPVSLTPRALLPAPKLASRDSLQQWATQGKASKRTKLQVHRLSSDFRTATKVVQEDIPALKPGQVVVRRAFAGVNASDVNFTSGRYFGSPEESAKLLPFDAGFEAVGVVAAVGPGVKGDAFSLEQSKPEEFANGLKVGDCVAEMVYGAFSEWGIVSEKLALPVPTCAPQVVALLTSGLTASIGLEVAGQMRSEETVLVTAAAGGTGQFVVQLAKAAGNHVIATCGSREKAQMLRRLGADRVINYREESVKQVLKAEYKKGVDLVWESVGGEMFETCVRALANGGRLIVIGMISQYGSGWTPSVSKGLLELLLAKSASVRGFFLPHHSRSYKGHLRSLASMWLQGRLDVSLDPTPFVGVQRAADAVEHLQTGNSVGKVVLQLVDRLPEDFPHSRL